MFNIHITIERWKYSEQYEVYVSTLGKVRDKNKKDIELLPDRAMCFKTKDGKLHSVHRLMMELFKPVENMRDLTVDHINGNCKDNRLSNLRWLSLEENEYLGQVKAHVVLEAKQAMEVDDVLSPSSENKICFRRLDSTEWFAASINSATKIIAAASGNRSKQVKADLKEFKEKKLNGKKKYGYIFKF